MGSPHARVGNCQASIQKSPLLTQGAFLRLSIAEIYLSICFNLPFYHLIFASYALFAVFS
ncbi:hypothetical protein ACUXHR_002109 [Pantoea piersonii]